jgi:hypothetical protein
VRLGNFNFHTGRTPPPFGCRRPSQEFVQADLSRCDERTEREYRNHADSFARGNHGAGGRGGDQRGLSATDQSHNPPSEYAGAAEGEQTEVHPSSSPAPLQTTAAGRRNTSVLKQRVGTQQRVQRVRHSLGTQYANSSFSVGGAAVATEAYAVCGVRRASRAAGCGGAGCGRNGLMHNRYEQK